MSSTNIIYKNQSNITLNVDTTINISTATVHQILYKKPDKTKGFFNATISGTQLVYQPVATDFDQEGLWELKAFVTMAGNDAYGDDTFLIVQPNLK